MNEKITIYVAYHKNNDFYLPDDPIYKPILCGASITKNKFGYTEDNQDDNDNISRYNKNFCELTGHYWAWKHDHDSDILGLAHYHRYFIHDKQILDRNLILYLLQNNKAILNGPSTRKKFVECDREDSVYTQYRNTHKKREMDLALEACEKLYPEDLPEFKRQIFHQKEIATNNMIIARRDIFEEYSKWLFDILFYVQKNGDISRYDEYQRRAYGFLAERLQRVFFCCRGYDTIECSTTS